MATIYLLFIGFLSAIVSVFAVLFFDATLLVGVMTFYALSAGMVVVLVLAGFVLRAISDTTEFPHSL